MNGWKLTFLTLIGMGIALVDAGQAQAQVYGGVWYGPRHHHSSFYAGVSPGYPVGGYYVSPYRSLAPIYAGSYTGVSTYYGLGSVGTGTSYGLGAYNPVVVAPNPIYGATTTIIRGGPTGGVVQYNSSGTGYTYVPDSTYPTVIQQQPTLGLSRTFVPPSPPPVVIESRPQTGSGYGLANSQSLPQFTTPANRPAGTIKLVCPKTAGGPLTYSLNGHVYTIQPGYSQTFRDDRAWTLEFNRGGDGSEIARQSLRAGTYEFALGTNGWELQQPGAMPATPTSDLPPAPLPDLNGSPTPSLPPTPLPPP